MAVLAAAPNPMPPPAPPAAMSTGQGSSLATLEAQVALLKAQLASTTTEVDVLKHAIRIMLQDKQRGGR